MRGERSIYFKWLEMIIENYEEERSDKAARIVWNWAIDKFKPDGFKKIEEIEEEDN
jgi:hypothetical protein